MGYHLVRNWHVAPDVSIADQLDRFLSACIMDDTKGNFATETVWDDTDIAKMDTIADTQLHRNVDVLILAADKEGEFRTSQSLPPKHASSVSRQPCLPTVTRVREDIPHSPFDDLRLRFWKTGGPRCSEQTLHANTSGCCWRYFEEARRTCRPGIERMAKRSC